MEAYKNNLRNFFSVIPANAGIKVLFGRGKRKKGLDSRVRLKRPSRQTLGENDKEGQKKVMAFGVFDRLHPGHISFLEQAAELGDELIVVVARDSIVHELKKKRPVQSQDIRISRLACVHGVTHAILGDQECGSWEIIAAHKPDIICLGYDQQGIKKDIEVRTERGLLPQIKIVIARAHQPDIYHSSMRPTA